MREIVRDSAQAFGYAGESSFTPVKEAARDETAGARAPQRCGIGIALSDEDQLHPEQSTGAIVVLHPQAKYFSV